jgi:nucleoside-diphosphate-sugar epimerase
MRSLILGGTSFVGGRLLEHLLDRGDDVSLLNRGRSGPPPSGVKLLVADRKDPLAMRAVLSASGDWDRVFDVSGFVMAAGGSAFEELLELLDGRTGRYVFVSSVMAYEPSGIFPWFETQPLRDEPATTYGGFKVYAERALMSRHRSTGFPAAIARPAAIYGRENNIYDMEAAMFLRLTRGLPIIVPHEGLVTTSYGHIDDLCEGLLRLAEHDAAPGEAFNITGEGVTSGQYVETLAQIVGVTPDTVLISPAALPDSTRLAYGHLFGARHHGILDYTKAQRLLGWTPRYDFRSGHEATYAWFRESPLAAADISMRDPLWGSGFDFDYEAEVAHAVRAAV